MAATGLSLTLAPSTPSPVPNSDSVVTPEKMLKFMQLASTMCAEEALNTSARRTARSTQMSAANILAAQFNAMRLYGAEELKKMPAGTLKPVMALCLEDIVVECESSGHEGGLTLVVFSSLDSSEPEGTENRFLLSRVGAIKWEYVGLIQLPSTLPDLTIVLESEVLGDIACFSVEGGELLKVSSARATEEGAHIQRDPLGDSASATKLSLVVGTLFTEETRYILDKSDATVRISEDNPLYTTAVLLKQAQELIVQWRLNLSINLQDEAIDCCSEALALLRSLEVQDHGTDTSDELCQASDSSKTFILVSVLITLGEALSNRFERTGDANDIQSAISYLEEALGKIETEGDPTPIYLSPVRNAAKRYLGLSSVRRFQSFGNVDDASRAIDLQREECEVSQSSDPGSWSRLGTSLRNRFEHSGLSEDIDESVECHRRALQLFISHADLQQNVGSRASLHSDLGSALLQKYKWNGKASDLDEAISCFREATSWIQSPGAGPSPSSNVSVEILNNFGMALLNRFRSMGELNDINEAISIQHQALSVMLPGDAVRHTILNNLALCWQCHYSHTHDRDSLRQTADALQRAVSATPHGHPKLPITLNNLATASMDIFRLCGQEQYLTQAIEAQTKAIALTPTGHPSLSMMHDSLGGYFRRKFTETADLGDIQRAIDAQREALALSSHTHPEYTTILASLGHSFLFRYKVSRDAADLSEAIQHMEDSLEMLTAEHSSAATHQLYLARGYSELYSLTNAEVDIDKSMSMFSLAANSPTTSPRVRIDIAKEWAGKSAMQRDPVRTLEAVQTYMDLVAVVTGMEWTLERRYEHLSQSDIPSFIIQAAGLFALKCLERPDKALEWLEQGRALVWQALSSLRAPLDDLRFVEPGLADRIQDVSKSLEQASMVSRRDMDLIPGILNADELEAKIPIHEQASLHARLSKEREDVLRTIRTTVPGFESFLQPRSVKDIMRYLPKDGPVIVLSVHLQGCYALALLAGLDEPMYIPLPDYTYEKALNAGSLLWATVDKHGLLSRGTAINIEDGEGASESEGDDEKVRALRRYKRKKGWKDGSAVGRILQELWEAVVKPIVEALALSPSSDPEDLTRIWWCTSGPMGSLPIHAAGIYSGDDPVCVADYAVSSYVPTVAVLTERVKNSQTSPGTKVSSKTRGIFMVSQPNTPGCTAIPGTTLEVEYLAQNAEDYGVPTRSLHGSEATIEESLKGLEEFSFVHLACHASQQQNRPLHSGFSLHDGRLELSTIMKLDLKGADVAFLSACQTSEGDRWVPEEAVHLAAAMLNAGYRGVVATMWSIQDEGAPQVTNDFYRHLLGACAQAKQDIVRLDGMGASRALHHAIRGLRNRVGVSDVDFLRWIPYVHFGM